MGGAAGIKGQGVALAEFWAEWGNLAYLLAAVWAFFEGETFVLCAAAVGSVTGIIDPWILMGSVWIGSFLGDQTWFTLGRRFGPAAVRRIPGAERRLATAAAMLERYGTVFVLSFRFLYGIRNVASAACGLAGMNRARFAVLNFLAAGIWASSFVAVGWYAAEWLGPENLAWGIAVAGLLVLMVVLWRIFGRRRRAALAPVEPA
jgi:membrane protein DedA with SNARE-associated domain